MIRTILSFSGKSPSGIVVDNEGYDLLNSGVCLGVARSKYAAIGDRVIKNALEIRGAMGHS